MRRSLMIALLTALMVIVMGIGTAFAGEVNAHGDDTGAKTRSNSICSFSGLNDGNPPPGRVQSYGQDVREGRADPKAFNPGDACQGGSNPRNP